MNELMNRLNLMDCMEGMKRFPDKFFDLAIVDPPYGIGQVWSKSKKDKFYYHKSSYTNDQAQKPTEEYITELFRVSKNQIIWGYNYFCHLLPETNSIIIWDKKRSYEKTFMSEAELAWTSFKKPVRIVELQWDGCKKGSETGIKKIHPFQKPIALYRWMLSNYARPDDKILDTHVGSGSSLVACLEGDFEFCGFEINEEYFSMTQSRIREVWPQGELFATV